MISASDLSSWDFCPRKVYFRRVLGIEPVKKEVMIKGIIKHKIFKEMINSYKETRNLEIENIIEDTLSRYIKDFEVFDTDLAKFRQELNSSFSILGEKINKNEFFVPEFCEEWFESRDLELKARVDVIFNESGDWIIGDLKTDTSDFLGTKLQIGAGALLFEKHMNAKVNKIKIISHNDWTEKEINLTDELRSQIFEKRDEIKTMLKNKNLPPLCLNPNKCSKCEFWESHCNVEKKAETEKESEWVWECEYCGKTFETKKECDKHEECCTKRKSLNKRASFWNRIFR
ncbi:MAG: Dna2/Cas4 domain-containing protein [Candidatus Helarchaeota archaeon]|nr:Dna2/Cas4 domain-containing protein [Candidatus Helarchaeota archaeon]